MKYSDLPLNSMGIVIHLEEEGGFGVTVMNNISEDWSEEEAEPYLDILNGLNMVLTNGYDMLGMYGALGRVVKDYIEGDGPEIEFEPDEELLQAIEDRKVVPFNKKKLN
jgi:hypothetical protein